MTTVTKTDGVSSALAKRGQDLGLPPARYFADRMIPADRMLGLSLLRLTGAYSGPCIRIRRAGDNAQCDVRFNEKGVFAADSTVVAINGGTDAIPLAGFALGQDCFMVRHFNQFQKNLDAVPPTTAAQPKVLDAGNLIRNGTGAPVVAFDGVDDFFDIDFMRVHPYALAYVGSTPDRASAGVPFVFDSRRSGVPGQSAGTLIAAPGLRQIFAGGALGDAVNNAGSNQTYVCNFNARFSSFYGRGGLIAAGNTAGGGGGDNGPWPVTTLRVGRSADGVAFSNTSYSTLIARNGTFEESANLAVLLDTLYADMLAA
jgi:hypothetical protein